MKKWKIRVLAWMMLVVFGMGNMIGMCGEVAKVLAASADERVIYPHLFEQKYFGYKKIESVQDGDFTIEVYENEKGERKRCLAKYSGTATVVTLPKVDCVMERTFEQNHTITEMVIPSTVTDFFMSAVYQCRNLKKVTFLEGNETSDLYIGPAVMALCNKIEEITFPKRRNLVFADLALYLNEGLKKVHFMEAKSIEMADRAFADCENLKNILFDGYVRLHLRQDNFSGSLALEKLELPECKNAASYDEVEPGVVMGSGCFKACYNLKTIVLPRLIQSMGVDNFSGVNGAMIYAQPGTAGYAYFSEDKRNTVVAPLDTPKPTKVPTTAPTAIPTVAPTKAPTTAPTAIPTVAPTKVPTAVPATEPTQIPFPEATPVNFATDMPEESKTPLPSAEASVPATKQPEENTEPSVTPEYTNDIVPTIEPGTKIRFVYNTLGGVLSSSYNTDSARYMEAYSDLETATRKGYVFSGWYTLPDGGEKIENGVICDREINVLYAHWTPCTYTLSLDANFGQVVRQEQTITYGQPYGALPVPVKEGSVFKGWYTRTNMGQLVTGEDICYAEENVTLYAVWENEFDVEFHAKGGKASFVRKLVKKDTAYGALPTAVKEGFVFDGWYTDSIGGTRVTSDMLFTLDTKQVLYAQWIKAEKEEIQTPLPMETPQPSQVIPTPNISENPVVSSAPKPVKTSSSKQSKPDKIKGISLKKDGQKIKIYWKKVKNATGYEMQIATNKSFTKGVIKKKTGKCTYVSSKLKAGRRYYVRIRACKLEKKKKTIYGKYSDVTSIRI